MAFKKTLNTFFSQIKSTDGFSLVELAIVLVIIGLITGSVLKGQELIESAKLRTLIHQIQETRTAVSVFIERYDALPGDFHQAKERIHVDLSNGNNNGQIEGNGCDLNSEAGSFWHHLQLSGLMPSLSKPNGALDFGNGLPATKLGGGITVSYGDFNTHIHWFVIGKKNGDKGDGPLLTPEQAQYIDQKLGNGKGDTGTVRATGEGCLKNGAYNLDEKKPVCTVYVMF